MGQKTVWKLSHFFQRCPIISHIVPFFPVPGKSVVWKFFWYFLRLRVWTFQWCAKIRPFWSPKRALIPAFFSFVRVISYTSKTSHNSTAYFISENGRYSFPKPQIVKTLVKKFSENWKECFHALTFQITHLEQSNDNIRHFLGPFMSCLSAETPV